MPRLYEDTVPDVDAKPGDDDLAVDTWAREHRKRTGYRFLSAAGIAVFITIACISRTEAEGTGLLVLIVLGAIAALGLAAAGMYKIATPPPKKRYPDW